MILSELAEVALSQKVSVDYSDTGIARDALSGLPALKNHALVIMGIRRCGKSTLAAQFVRKQKGGYFYLNFDDLRLSDWQVRDYRQLDKVIEESKKRLLFFDEIQSAPKWELYVRQKLDAGYQVVVTGSNASLLSRELGTKLTGRHLDKELFPFSYPEFLRWKHRKASAASLDAYLQSGGFPEYLKTGDPEVITQLQNDILFRDIIVRYGLRDAGSLRKLLSYMASNAAQRLAPSRLTSVAGVKSATTVLEYLHYFESSYLLQLVPRFAWSARAQDLAPKKVYFSDLGLIHSGSISMSGNWGALLENFVYQHLRLQSKDIYYFANDTAECDFVLNLRKKPLCVQVCHELTLDNQDREIKGAFAAMDFFNVKEGFILTRNQTDLVTQGNKTVQVIPAWKYFGG
jgi:predicted AAA+ superfamily ATPase